MIMELIIEMIMGRLGLMILYDDSDDGDDDDDDDLEEVNYNLLLFSARR